MMRPISFVKWFFLPLLLSGLVWTEENASNQNPFRHGKKSAYTESDRPPLKPFYWEWKFISFQVPILSNVPIFQSNMPIAPGAGAALGFNFTRNFSLNVGYYGVALRQGTNEIFPSKLFPNEPTTNNDGTTNDLFVDYIVGFALYPLYANTHQSTFSLNLRFETEFEKFPFPPYVQAGVTYNFLFHRPWGGGQIQFVGGPGLALELGVLSSDPDNQAPRVQIAFSMLISPVYEKYLNDFFNVSKSWVFGFSISAGIGSRF